MEKRIVKGNDAAVEVKDVIKDAQIANLAIGSQRMGVLQGLGYDIFYEHYFPKSIFGENTQHLYLRNKKNPRLVYYFEFVEKGNDLNVRLQVELDGTGISELEYFKENADKFIQKTEDVLYTVVGNLFKREAENHTSLSELVLRIQQEMS